MNEKLLIIQRARGAAKCREQSFGDICTADVRNSLFSVKRLLKAVQPQSTAVKEPREFSGKIRAYIKKYSPRTEEELLPVLDKIVCAAAEKYFVKIPASEIIIYADPIHAAAVILKLKNAARLFSVVSREENVGNMYDELYFKHGIVVRHIPYITKCADDSIVMKCNDEKNGDIFGNALYITLNAEPSVIGRGICAATVALSDKRTEEAQRLLGIHGSAALYKLLGIKPDESTTADINSRGGEIFLLDTAHF